MKSLLNEIFSEIINGYKKLIATATADNDNGENTKETATNRLRLVLMHDRTNLSAETMEKMRDELLEVISKYVVVDEELLDLNLAAEGDAVALLASIPILRAKTKEEQEEAIRALEEKRQKEFEDLEEIEDQEDEEDLENAAEDAEEADEDAEIEDLIGEELQEEEVELQREAPEETPRRKRAD